LTMPWMWCRGSACSTRSSPTNSHASVRLLIWEARPRCVCRAPLGRPVVPLV